MTLKINQGTKFGTLKKPMFSLLDVIIFQFTGIMKHEIIAFPKGFHFEVASHHWSATLILLQWNSDFSNHLGKSKLVWIIKRFEKTWLKLLCLTGEGKVGLVWIIRNFKKTESLRNRDSTVKVNFCCGSQHSVHWQSFGNNSAVGGPGGDTDPSEASCLVTIGKLQPTSVPQASDLVSYPPVTEFVSRHSLDGKFTFVDQR